MTKHIDCRCEKCYYSSKLGANLLRDLKPGTKIRKRKIYLETGLPVFDIASNIKKKLPYPLFITNHCWQDKTS